MLVREGKLTSTPDLGGVATVGPELLETTFDQLRTLVLVAETGSALSAARVLGREQSSVQKQLDTLNRSDATATEIPQFTIERQQSGMHSRFRCDLALVPDHLLPMVNVQYIHSTRASEQAFTDHSGILMDIPVTLDTVTMEDRHALFALLPEPPDHALLTRSECQPHKTAMSRVRPSPYARTVVDVLVPRLGITSVLDHGCGRGSDVDHYRAAGLDADGWDPHMGFGWTAKHDRQYDLVTNIFVLNVLSDPWQRIQALQHAAQFVRPGGSLFVVTRSPTDIDLKAASANWPSHQDGYWSSEAKGTFQKGISTEEIIALGLRAGLEPTAEQTLLTNHPLLVRHC